MIKQENSTDETTLADYRVKNALYLADLPEMLAKAPIQQQLIISSRIAGALADFPSPAPPPGADTLTPGETTTAA